MKTHKTFWKTNEGWKVIVDHKIEGVTPQMIDWWWDHIDTTTRYRFWHPTDHISFGWICPPSEVGHVGAIHRVVEYLDGKPETPATIDIRWEDASRVSTEYAHVLLATVSGDVKGELMHEYEAMPGGIRMRSHFTISGPFPEAMIEALIIHNQQEMQNFSLFLPALHFKETHRTQECM